MSDGEVIIDLRIGDSKIDGDMNSAQQKIEKSSSKLGTVMGKTATAIGKTFAAGLAAGSAALISMGKSGIELASDLAEVQNVVDTTFGENSSKIEEFAQSAVESFGLSELSAKQMTSTMGAMVKSMGLSDEAVLEMSTNLTGLAGDMASFYNLDPTEAFEKLRAGISGETEPLKQLGINMSVVNLEAYAMSQGIEESYSEMSAAEQATLRYNYILSATADAQGDFEKTSDSFANQQRILSEEIKSLSAEMGEVLLPVMTEGINVVRESVIGNEDFKNVLKDVFSAVSQVAADAIPALIDIINGLLPVIGDLVRDVLPILLNLFQSLMEPVVSLAQKALPVLVNVFDKLIPPISKLIEAILPPLLDLFDALSPLIDALLALLVPLIDALSEIAPPIINAINQALRPFIDIIEEIVNTILPPFQSIISEIVESWVSAFANLKENMQTFSDSVRRIFTNLVDIFKNLISGNWRGIWENAKAIVGNAFTGMKALVKSPVNAIIDMLNKLIRGINTVRIPDWVPGIGGKGINIPTIPRLRVGMDFVPSDNFPALLHRGEAVLTAAEAERWRSGYPMMNYAGIGSYNSQNGGIDYDKLACAMSGLRVVMDGKTVGRLVEPSVSTAQARKLESMQRSGFNGRV